jgi:hypothetical protein
MFKKYYLLLGLITISFLAKSMPANANCADSIASLELVKPAIERLIKTIEKSENFVSKIEGDKIILTAEFDNLTGIKKQQFLNLFDNWFGILTKKEQQAALNNSGIGAMSPYGIYASDGRALSLPYDGCTRNLLLTERSRFSWYLNRSPDRSNSTVPVTGDDLRNAGEPFWRNVKFPLSKKEEKRTRLLFWQEIGYEQNKSWWNDSGWWIAWVPERGHFEINLPNNYDLKILEKFWRVAPHQYKYAIVLNDGTWLGDHKRDFVTQKSKSILLNLKKLQKGITTKSH